MPFITWINEIFPEPQAPYTIKEIVTRLQQLYSPHITSAQAYRALSQLADNPAFAHIMAPLDDGERYHVYSAEAARRIARKVTNCRPPERGRVASDHDINRARLAEQARLAEAETQKSELKRNIAITRGTPPIARGPRGRQAV